MQKELIDWIELELKSYKRYIAILKELDIAGIQAQQLSDMPRSVTNKFHSATEELALNDKDKIALTNSISRIDNWLNYLNYKERYIVTSTYIELYKPHKIIREWELKGEPYHPENYWYYIKKQALKKIARLYV